MLGWDIIATSGTASALSQEGVECAALSSLTNKPDLLDGRIKALYPEIFGGILYLRGNQTHESEVRRYGLHSIELVICNFYPLSMISEAGETKFEKIQSQIDIGGPALVRAAAKNCLSVIPLVNPEDYDDFVQNLHKVSGDIGKLDEEYRFSLAAKAFSYVSEYDETLARIFRDFQNVSFAKQKYMQ